LETGYEGWDRGVFQAVVPTFACINYKSLIYRESVPHPELELNSSRIQVWCFTVRVNP